MALFQEADAWVAKKLFFPIIIAVCRTAGISQYGFASYATVSSLLCIVPLVMEGGAGANRLFQLAMLALVGAMLAFHAMRPELVRRSRGFWRAFGWGMIVLNVIEYLAGDFRIFSLMMWLLLLFAEYALLIDTIPPAPAKQRAGRTQPRGG